MMLVLHILDAARKRLAVLSREAPVCEAAAILANSDTPLVVVCDSGDVAVGVISRTDIVKTLATSGPDLGGTRAGDVMTAPAVSFHIDHPLQRVWEVMSSRSLRCAPILDGDRRPKGIVHARDLASALLDEVTQEELLLRDYVLGVGYQ